VDVALRMRRGNGNDLQGGARSLAYILSHENLVRPNASILSSSSLVCGS
jgi:hypothetical protein